MSDPADRATGTVSAFEQVFDIVGDLS